jgi:DMSO/TMAO reductase YedYZ molybdopterin-dependent catalytic subunit
LTKASKTAAKAQGDCPEVAGLLIAANGFTLLDHDRPGFWERNGYHAYGDPWKQQRHSGK